MAFDHRATGGFGRGEGVGCLILKPLDAAIRDGDTIRSIIRNSGVNQDGKTVGITMPNPDAQESLARSVYRSAGLDPLDTQYVECHGTGRFFPGPMSDCIDKAKALLLVIPSRRRPWVRFSAALPARSSPYT